MTMQTAMKWRNPIPLQNCFAADPGVGSTRRDDHYGWAQRQDSGRLANNLASKIGVLFNCSSVDGEKLVNAFADISVIIANYVPSTGCFAGDRVTDKNRSAHEAWARTKTRNEMNGNLQWKAAGAIKCLERAAQNDYFTDVSLIVAKAPGSTGGGLPPTGDGCSGGYRIQAPSSVAAGSRITIRFGYSGAQPGADAWIGLFPVGSNHYREWYNVKAMPGCEGTFTAPGPGNYEFRYLLDSGYDKVAARASITVQ